MDRCGNVSLYKGYVNIKFWMYKEKRAICESLFLTKLGYDEK